MIFWSSTSDKKYGSSIFRNRLNSLSFTHVGIHIRGYRKCVQCYKEIYKYSEIHNTIENYVSILIPDIDPDRWYNFNVRKFLFYNFKYTLYWYIVFNNNH